MLLMVRAQTAVEWAPRLGPCLRCQGPIARFQPILLALPIGIIVANLCFLNAVFAAALQIPYGTIFNDHFGWDWHKTSLAQTRRLAMKDIRGGLTFRRALMRRVRERSR
jgi:hypothetical protein